MKASELILDFTLYPRTRIDADCVHFMVQAREGGAKFPPVVVDKASNRVVDGFHRITMYKRINAAHPVEVVEREYESDAEMFADAVRLNANHGRNLSVHDRKHCLLRSKELGLTVDKLASALSMTVEAVGELRSEGSGQLRIDGQSKKIATRGVTPSHAGKMNAARAKQVLEDINHTLERIDGECDRIELLIREARSGKYWRVLYGSEQIWDKVISNVLRKFSSSLFGNAHEPIVQDSRAEKGQRIQ